MIFLSHDPSDAHHAEPIRALCAALGARVWPEGEDAATAANPVRRRAAISEAKAFVAVLTGEFARSLLCSNEAKLAARSGARCIAVASEPPTAATAAMWATVSQDPPLDPTAPDFRIRLAALLMASGALARNQAAPAPAVAPPPREPSLTQASPIAALTTGKFFINFSSTDRLHAEFLRDALNRAGVPHWDFLKGDRDLQRALVHEIEVAITASAGVLSVVTNNWRDSQWVLREYLFAREIGKPTFLLQFEPIRPTLVIAERTLIDCVVDRQAGVRTLLRELQSEAV